MSFTFNGQQVDDPHFNGEQVDFVYVDGVFVWQREEELNPPTNLETTPRESADFVRLTWDKNSGSGVNTEVQRNGFPIANTAQSEFLDYALGSGECATYRVRNYLDDEYTDFSNEILGCTRHSDPGKVTGMTATSGTHATSVVLTWNVAPNSSDTPIQYNVYRDNVFLVQTTNLTHDDTTVDIGVEYEYKVKSCFGEGEVGCADFSDPATGYAGVIDEGILPPNNFTASSGTRENEVIMSWSHPTALGTPVSYEIRADNVVIATVDYPDAQYTYATTNVGKDINFSIVSIDVHNNHSNSVSTNGFAGVSQVQGVDASNGLHESRVRISWSAVPGSSVMYKVYRYDTSTGGTGTFVGQTTGLAMDYNTTNTTDQYYSVVAVGNSGNGYGGIESTRNLGYPGEIPTPAGSVEVGLNHVSGDTSTITGTAYTYTFTPPARVTNVLVCMIGGGGGGGIHPSTGSGWAGGGHGGAVQHANRNVSAGTNAIAIGVGGGSLGGGSATTFAGLSAAGGGGGGNGYGYGGDGGSRSTCGGNATDGSALVGGASLVWWGGQAGFGNGGSVSNPGGNGGIGAGGGSAWFSGGSGGAGRVQISWGAAIALMLDLPNSLIYNGITGFVGNYQTARKLNIGTPYERIVYREDCCALLFNGADWVQMTEDQIATMQNQIDLWSPTPLEVMSIENRYTVLTSINKVKEFKCQR